METELNRYEIRLDEFERKETYNFFSNFKKKWYSVTIDICIDGIIRYMRKSNESFYCLMTYLILKACNKIDNFCYRRIGDRVYQYRNIAASCTVLMPTKNIDFTNHIYYKESLCEFSKQFHKKKEEVLSGRICSDLNGSYDLVYITAMPWFRLKSINNVRATFEDDTIPRFSWGKYFEQNNKMYVDLSLELSHIFIDGYHIHLFVDELEKAIEELNCQ